MRIQNRNRGGFMLGFAALTVLLASFSAIALLRASDSYAASARTEQHLQSRAAAEGAALLLQENPAVQFPLRIGNTTVHLQEATPGQQLLAVHVESAIPGKPFRVTRYRMGPQAAAGGPVPFLEVTP